MSDVTSILSQIEFSDPSAAEQLLPLVYDELRKLAAAKLAHEKPGQTLQATALVHEAYLRLVGGLSAGSDCKSAAWFENRGHFFAAAAEAMRRILIESARRKARYRHGGGLTRVDLLEGDLVADLPPEELLSLDETLSALAKHDPAAAELVKLRYFAGLTIEQAADAIGMSRTTAWRQWTYAKAWLFSQLRGSSGS
jgi:RNA polymerase sigma factor (TIGR02999 family)